MSAVESPNEEDDSVAELLEKVGAAYACSTVWAQVQVGGGGVEAGLDTQGRAGAARFFQAGAQAVGGGASRPVG